MTNEQLKTILEVIDRIAPKYTFGYYDVDDIKQEAYIICVEGLESYDDSRPFQNFISKHLSNRLKTLVRNKYTRKNIESERHEKLNESKKNLMDLLSYDPSYEWEEEDQVEKLSNKEALEKIRAELSPAMRNDFDRLANGVSIQSARKTSLFKRVREILGEGW